MRWTERQINQMDRESQIVALQYAKNSLIKSAQYIQGIDSAGTAIQQMELATAKMRTGVPAKLVFIAAAVFWFVGSFILGFWNALNLAVILAIVYFVFDKVKRSPARKQKADEYYAQQSPALLHAMENAKQQYAAFMNSEEMQNTRLLLPDDYLSLEKIDGLINLLQGRRCRSISEAMSAYETMEHQRKLEKIEQEKLRAAQESAAAQQRAAEATERIEKQNQEMAAEQKRQTETISKLQVSQGTGSMAGKKGKKTTVRDCPYCRMKIPFRASICPYCRSEVDYFDDLTLLQSFRANVRDE